MDLIWICFGPVGQQRAAGDAGARAATSRAGAGLDDGTITNSKNFFVLFF